MNQSKKQKSFPKKTYQKMLEELTNTENEFKLKHPVPTS
jgi:hypothetical protein